MQITNQKFGITHQGEPVTLFNMENDRGLSVKISTYGATVTSIIFPDKYGKKADIALGFDNLEQYLGAHPYFGVICGRYANRISKGVFEIDGVKCQLITNDGSNFLHGGKNGFDRVVWHAVPFQSSHDVGVKLTYLSKDMEDGFPGNLLVEVIYSINNLNEFSISYLAETDVATVVNLTNHTYFNLNGCKDNILKHMMTINADKLTEVNGESIPTGRSNLVESTPFDFRTQKAVGQQIEIAGGYDHNYILNKSLEDELSFAGAVFDPESGRSMEAFTTEPGMQFYSGNKLDGIKGKDEIGYKKHYGFCWEAQHFPDSPNNNHFPSTELYPGEQYNQLTIYRFGIKE